MQVSALFNNFHTNLKRNLQLHSSSTPNPFWKTALMWLKLSVQTMSCSCSSISSENISVDFGFADIVWGPFLGHDTVGWIVRRVSKSAPSTISLYTTESTHNTRFIRFAWRIGNTETRKRYVTETCEERKSWNIRYLDLRHASALKIKIIFDLLFSLLKRKHVA